MMCYLVARCPYSLHLSTQVRHRGESRCFYTCYARPSLCILSLKRLLSRTSCSHESLQRSGHTRNKRGFLFRSASYAIIILNLLMSDSTSRSRKPPQAKWAKALTVVDAQAELGPLKTTDDVTRWLERIPLMARVGRLRSKYVTSSLVSTIRTWCRNHGRELSSETMKSFETKLAAIEATTGRQVTSVSPQATLRSAGAAARGKLKDLRVRQRRRLADRRSGNECRSGEDRRENSRRQRESSGRRGGLERRGTDRFRRTGAERRKLNDRRGLAP